MKSCNGMKIPISPQGSNLPFIFQSKVFTAPSRWLFSSKDEFRRQLESIGVVVITVPLMCLPFTLKCQNHDWKIIELCFVH